jgi:hypothetical protein
MILYIVLQINRLQTITVKRKINIVFILLSALCLQPVFSQLSDSLRIDYNYINSVPQNAEVYLDDELAGHTPLFFTWSDSVFPKILKIKMKGYADYVETASDVSLINKTYNLVPLKGSRNPNPVKEDKATYFNKPRKVIPIVISSIAALGAGASAYYFKSLAIENRDYFDETGDPAALDRKKKYDVISGVSIAVFQLGVGALIYFLFIDN